MLDVPECKGRRGNKIHQCQDPSMALYIYNPQIWTNRVVVLPENKSKEEDRDKPDKRWVHPTVIQDLNTISRSFRLVVGSIT